ncbi:hypothetical protein BGX26_008691 [Mortierella sp. AD094]|nr:hypothetical protein BGX26_008691 [Mortierella sp. AD094]
MSTKRSRPNSEQDISSSSDIISVSLTDNIGKLLDLIKAKKNATGSADIIISVYDDKTPSSESAKSQKTKRQKTSDGQEKEAKDEFINVQIRRSLVLAPQTTQGGNDKTDSNGITSIHEGKDEPNASEDEPDSNEDETDTSEDEPDADRATPTQKSKDEPDRNRYVWWMHIETEITIGFFETAEDGIEFLEEHELEPFGNNDGSYQAYFDPNENAYENPVFSFFYRKNSDDHELITLERMPVGYQICFEHDE